MINSNSFSLDQSPLRQFLFWRIERCLRGRSFARLERRLADHSRFRVPEDGLVMCECFVEAWLSCCRDLFLVWRAWFRSSASTFNMGCAHWSKAIRVVIVVFEDVADFVFAWLNCLNCLAWLICCLWQSFQKWLHLWQAKTTIGAACYCWELTSIICYLLLLHDSYRQSLWGCRILQFHLQPRWLQLQIVARIHVILIVKMPIDAICFELFDFCEPLFDSCWSGSSSWWSFSSGFHMA